MTDLWWDRAWLSGIPSLGLVAAFAAFLRYRGPRLEDPNRLRRTLVTGALSCTFPTVSGLLPAPRDEAEFVFTTLVTPHPVLLPARAMALWQHLAAGPRSGRLRGRFDRAVLALVATSLLSAGGLLRPAMASGLPD